MIYASENQIGFDLNSSSQDDEYRKAQQWGRREKGQPGADWDVYLQSQEAKVELEVLIYNKKPGCEWAR